MAKLIFIYTVFCFMTVHLTFVVSENGDEDVTKSSLLISNGILANFDNKDSYLSHSTDDKQNTGSYVGSIELSKLHSTQNLDEHYENANLSNNKSAVNNAETDNDNIELPQLFIDSQSRNNLEYKTHSNYVTISKVNRDTALAPVTSEPENDVYKSENTPDDETEVTTSYNDHNDKGSLWDEDADDDDEDYGDNQPKEIAKKDQIDSILGKLDDDNDDDEEYSVTKWEEHGNDDGDDYSDKDYEDENEDDSDMDESKNQNAEESVDEAPDRHKQPTAPTSMVLFYTWMIIAVIIIIVAISTYQSRCRGIRFPWKRAGSKPRDDHKRLIEHEFV